MKIGRRGTVTAETGGRVSTRPPEHIQLAKIRRRGCSKMIPGSEKHATAPGVGVEPDDSNNISLCQKVDVDALQD